MMAKKRGTLYADPHKKSLKRKPKVELLAIGAKQTDTTEDKKFSEYH